MAHYHSTATPRASSQATLTRARKLRSTHADIVPLLNLPSPIEGPKLLKKKKKKKRKPKKKLIMDDAQKMAALSRRAGRELRPGIQEYNFLESKTASITLLVVDTNRKKEKEKEKAAAAS